MLDKVGSLWPLLYEIMSNIRQYVVGCFSANMAYHEFCMKEYFAYTQASQ